ncbi:MAG: hypothetical protein AB8B91_15890 [Rubripirellula sp.]
MAVAKANTSVEVEENVLTMDRRRTERRDGNPEATDNGVMENPRRKKQRRRHIDPTTCERDYSDQEIEFMRAMDDYKHSSGRMFPTCSEVLEVVRNLGYHQLSDEQAEQLGLVAEEEPYQGEAGNEDFDDEDFDA